MTCTAAVGAKLVGARRQHGAAAVAAVRAQGGAAWGVQASRARGAGDGAPSRHETTQRARDARRRRCVVEVVPAGWAVVAVGGYLVPPPTPLWIGSERAVDATRIAKGTICIPALPRVQDNVT
jgi:hypothetical protein